MKSLSESAEIPEQKLQANKPSRIQEGYWSVRGLCIESGAVANHAYRTRDRVYYFLN